LAFELSGNESLKGGDERSNFSICEIDPSQLRKAKVYFFKNSKAADRRSK
jgi:hypothetical protein